MKARRLISILLSAALILTGITAFAAGELLIEDYSTSSSGSKPASFSSWAPGGFQNPKPEIAVETNVYGKGATDASGKITWPTGSNAAYKPYARADIASVTTSNTVKLSFSAAADDKNSSKAVYLTDTRSVISTDANVMILFAKDGGIYSYGQKLAEYKTGTWYHFDIEVSGTSCTVYINGKAAGTLTASGAVGATTYLYYGMYDKTETTAVSTFCTDDIVVEYGAVSANRKTEITSTTYTIGDTLITGIGSGVTAGSLLSGINGGNATLSVVDNLDADVASGESLALGMKLKIVSADGVNTRYYDLDCLAAEISGAVNGSSTRELTQDFEVTFNGTGSVQFFVNGSAYGAPVATSPYTATVNHTAGGSYSVYAVISTPGGSQQTDTITYTFVPNAVPTVTLSGITNGAEYTGTDTFNVAVNAVDTDGTVENVALYLDGVAQTAQNGTYSFGPISLGNHTVYAEATDNDGATGKSANVTFSVTTRSKVLLEDKIDFTNANGTFRLVTDDTRGEKVNTEDSYGDYMKFSSTDGTGLQYYQSSVSWSNSALATPVYAECDVKVSNTQMRTWVFAMRQGAGIYVRPGVIENGYMGTVPIAADTWYHYKLMIDLPNQTSKIWVWDNTNSEYVLAATDNNVAQDVWGAMYFFFNQNSADVSDWNASVDNIEFYQMIEEPYLTSVQYLNAGGDNVLANGKVGYDVSEIKLNFNNKLSTTLAQDPTLLADCVTLSQNGAEVDNLSVSITDNSLSITLGDAVRTLSDYTLTYTGIIDIYDNAVADGTINFTTGPAEYDVLEWTVKVNGTTVTSLSGISSGDTVDVSAKLVNQAAQPQTSKLVVVLYSGNKCLGMTATDLTVGTTPSADRSANSITVTGTVDDTLKLYAYVWSDLGSTRTIQIQSLYMQ